MVPKNPNNFNVDNVRVVKINGEPGVANMCSLWNGLAAGKGFVHSFTSGLCTQLHSLG